MWQVANLDSALRSWKEKREGHFIWLNIEGSSVMMPADGNIWEM